jgi:hypothetical protein
MRGPHVRFCERADARLISERHPTRWRPIVCLNKDVAVRHSTPVREGQACRYAEWDRTLSAALPG